MEGLKASTINRHLATVISFYTYLAWDDPKLVCPVQIQRHFLRKPERLPRSVSTPMLQQFFSVVEDVPRPSYVCAHAPLWFENC